ncbi:MAG: Rnase Y domain-containing protein, partial [Actinomycetota bacterium]|nr:Rnase Y domain-containing protein [Actinomycetota bacterium]
MDVSALLLVGAGALVLAVVGLLLVVMTLARRGADMRADIEQRECRITERESRLDAQAREIRERAAELGDLEEQRRTTLERLAGLTAEQARAEL